MQNIIVKTFVASATITATVVALYNQKLKRDQDIRLAKLAQDQENLNNRWEETKQEMKDHNEKMKQMNAESSDRIRVALENLASEDPRWSKFLDIWNN